MFLWFGCGVTAALVSGSFVDADEKHFEKLSETRVLLRHGQLVMVTLFLGQLSFFFK